MFPWMSFLTYVVVTAATPGPNNLMSLSNAGRLGLRRALPFNLGVWAGFSAVMVLCTLFCSLLTEALPRIQFPLKMVGAAYMLSLAWKTLKSTGELAREGARAGFGSGLLLQFVNPKAYIYGIVSMEAYVLPFYAGQPGALLCFALILAFVGFAFTVCWAVFGSVLHGLFTQYARVTNLVMALLLVYCAVSLFF